MAIQVAKTSKARKARKALSHIEIHPKLGGGHLVRHVYHGFGNEPNDVHFGKEQGEQALAHVRRHTGIGGGTEPYDHRDESETEDEIKA